MIDMNGMVDRCLDAMNSMMGSASLLIVLIVPLVFWLVGLAAVGVLGFWVVRRLSGQTPSDNFGQRR